MVKQPKARAKSASTHATSRGTAGASKPKTPAARPRANPVTIDRVRAWFSEVASPRWPVPADEHLLPICDLLNSPAFIDPEFRRQTAAFDREDHNIMAADVRRVIAAVECLLDRDLYFFHSREAHLQIEKWLPEIASEGRRLLSYTRTPWHYLAIEVFDVVSDAWHEAGRNDRTGRGKGSPAVALVQKALRATGIFQSEAAIGYALQAHARASRKTVVDEFGRAVNGGSGIADGRAGGVEKCLIAKDVGTEPKKNRGRPPGKMR
jgi:hypothetical protein